MYRFAIVTGQPDRFVMLAGALTECAAEATVKWYHSAAAALEAVVEAAPDLMVVDENLAETGALSFLRRLMAINAMIHTAVASSLTPDRFHETYEGLGVLMQLPPEPDRSSAQDLLVRLQALIP
jgi:DNA-binding response OmpR family regulator